MVYDITFKDFFDAVEADLAQFDDELIPAIEFLSLNRSAEQSAKTDQANNTLDRNDKPESMKDFSDRAQKESDKILASIERRGNATMKILAHTWQTNDKFIEEYNGYKDKFKLVDQIQVINWSYGHNAEQYLHSKIAKLRAVITTNANYLNNWQNIPDDALLKKSGKALDKELVGEMGAPSSIDTSKEFMGHLRAQFRGRKSEKTYRGEMVNAFINEVRSFAKTKTSYSQDIEAAKRIAKSVQSIVESRLKSNDLSDEDKQSILKLQRNIHRMLMLYVDMIYFTYRLHVEYILNRRVLISKLFQK